LSQWVRNAVMLVVLGVWAVVVLHSLLVKGMPPDAVTWGVPGAVYFALNPSLPRRQNNTAPPARGEST
jgi:hypothetical protein